MPTKAELQAELDAMKAQLAQASPDTEDPRIAQAVALGIPREVAVAQFTGDTVAQDAAPATPAPKWHATFLRNGKPDRVMYLDDGKYLAAGSVGTDGRISRVRKHPVGLLAAVAEDDAQWTQLRSQLLAAAKCEGTYTYDLGDVFNG